MIGHLLPPGAAEGTEGFTLIEMSVAMAMLVAVSLVAFSALSIFLQSENEALGTGQATEKTGFAMNELRQELVSANILYNPATEGSNAGTTGITSTTSNGSATVTSAAAFTDVVVGMSVTGTGIAASTTVTAVQSFSSISISAAATATGTNTLQFGIPANFSLRAYTQENGALTCIQWRLTATGNLQTRAWSNEWQTNGIVRGWTTLVTGLQNSASSPPFVLDNASNYGDRLLDVDLVIIGNNGAGGPVATQSSITARDAEFYPSTAGECSTVPSP